MLYGNQSISTYTRSNVFIWMAMAFQGGVLNVGGFMACHRFVSHVTGFSTFLGVEVVHQNFVNALGMLLVPAMFLSGSMLSGQLVDIRLKLQKKPKYHIIFGVMFFLVLLVTIGGFNHFFGKFGEPLEQTRDYTLLALLCLICGLQNGTVTTVSRAVVRTTHLTGITTDLGIGLVRLMHRRELGDLSEEIKANWMRVGIILFFGIGSIIGAFLFDHWGFRGFLLPAILSGMLFGITYYFQAIRDK